MDQNNGYPSECKGRYRFVFLGFLFPVFHYLIMLVVQAVATVIKSSLLSAESIQNEAEMQEKLLVFLAKLDVQWDVHFVKPEL